MKCCAEHAPDDRRTDLLGSRIGWLVWGVPSALILLGLWTWKRLLRSRFCLRRTLRRAFRKERARDALASDAEILQRILHSLHGRWGEDLIEQIVADHPTPEAIADLVVRMERGALPAGFDPRRNLRKGP